MSFLLDPLAFLVVGYLAAKVNYLALIFEQHINSRGRSRRNLLIVGAVVISIFWLYSSLLYLGIIPFPWPLTRWYGGTVWMLNSGLPLGLTRSSTTDAAAILVFASYPFWYYLGTKFGLTSKVQRERKIRERNKILTELVRTAFPRGGPIPPSADDVGAPRKAVQLLEKIPPAYEEGLTILLFVFNSRLTVLTFTRRWRRFVDLDRDRTSTREKRKYLESWESNPFLLGALKFLELVLAYSYYTNDGVWKYIDYNGPSVPDDPPWLRQVS
ncbi:MAG: hypothetical protein OK474_04315 [Thaumarchaeota archaeon]|nr:hypothetical protein [Nitrososphaerota archaeon]